MTVKKCVPYALWDKTGLEQWLDGMAAKGYALEQWPGFSFIGRVKFQQDTGAIHSRYRLDPIGERIGELELRDRAASYREFGWHFVGKIGKLYAIYRCDDPEVPELYSDPESMAWAMKKQLRLAWVSVILWMIWTAVLFRNDWPLLLHWPSELLMNLILQAEILIPLYVIMLIYVFDALSGGIGTFLGIRRVRAYLRRGEWPPAGRRRYPEFFRFLAVSVSTGLLILFLVYLAVSGVRHTIVLQGQEEWNFPHITVEEVLPEGTALWAYSSQEMLHSDTFDRSILAPEQYDVAQGGMAITADGARKETRLSQEYIRAAASLARAIYQGRVEAQRHSLEDYRKNWEENTSLLHANLPNAYSFLEEEPLSSPTLDSLTRFVYQFSDETSPRTVYIGLVQDQIFVLRCSGAVEPERALELISQRLTANI